MKNVFTKEARYDTDITEVFCMRAPYQRGDWAKCERDVPFVVLVLMLPLNELYLLQVFTNYELEYLTNFAMLYLRRDLKWQSRQI